MFFLMTIIFFSKCLKFDLDWRNGKKNQKKFLDLKIIAFESGTTNSHNPEQDTCQWQSTCYETPLTFNISLREIFLRSSSLRVIKNMMKVLSCWFYKSLGSFNMSSLKGCSKIAFLESGLTKSFRAFNFRNKVPMTIIFFFSKSFKFDVDSRNGLKKSEEVFGFKDNCNSLNLEKDICHCQSMCYETPLRFKISLREIFLKSGSPRVLKKCHENAFMQILQEFGTL